MEKTKKTPIKCKSTKKTDKCAQKKQHWIESRAHLTKILEASGVGPTTCAMLITCNQQDR